MPRYRERDCGRLEVHSRHHWRRERRRPETFVCPGVRGSESVPRWEALLPGGFRSSDPDARRVVCCAVGAACRKEAAWDYVQEYGTGTLTTPHCDEHFRNRAQST